MLRKTMIRVEYTRYNPFQKSTWVMEGGVYASEHDARRYWSEKEIERVGAGSIIMHPVGIGGALNEDMVRDGGRAIYAEEYCNTYLRWKQAGPTQLVLSAWRTITRTAKLKQECMQVACHPRRMEQIGLP